MERMERFYRIDQMIGERSVVPIESFLGELEISRPPSSATSSTCATASTRRSTRTATPAATVSRPRRSAPRSTAGPLVQPTEIYALLTMQHLLASSSPACYAAHRAAARAPATRCSERGRPPPEKSQRRVAILQHGRARRSSCEFFEIAATAHAQPQAACRSPTTSRPATRPPSASLAAAPRFYRDNWYLDAWCHLREGISQLRGRRHPRGRNARRAREGRPRGGTRRVLAAGYGIFSGKAKDWAKLRFTPSAARWVAAEHWHSEAARPLRARRLLRARNPLQRRPRTRDGHPQVWSGLQGRGAAGVEEARGRPGAQDRRPVRREGGIAHEVSFRRTILPMSPGVSGRGGEDGRDAARSRARA